MIEGTEEKSEILRDAAHRIADVDGMVLAVAIQYLYVDVDGIERIGGYYTGGIMNATGMTAQAHDELLDQFRTWGDDDDAD